MEKVGLSNKGKGNIINTGEIKGDLITGNKNVILNFNMMDYAIEFMQKLNETVEALNNICKSQVLLSEAMLKQKEIDLKDAESRLIMAKAAENNSIASLNISEALTKDKDFQERLITLLENIQYK